LTKKHVSIGVTICWGTEARARSISNSIFSGHFRAAQNLTVDFM